MQQEKDIAAKKILVAGAAGKTGTLVVEMLTKRGFDVRAMVHHEDERSKQLKAHRIEVIVADFLDLASLRRAVENVDRIYFSYPPSEGLLNATANIAVAAQDEGVEALVNMSQLPARENARSALTRDHWLSENILDWADIGASHIRPTFLAEELYLFTAGAIGREGKIPLPFGKGKHAPISSEDVARVVVGIIADPGPHMGKRYLLTGPQNMSLVEIADVIGRSLDVSVEYINIPLEEWRQSLVKNGGVSEYIAAHLAAVAQDHQDGVFSAETDVVNAIGGREPQTLENFVRKNRNCFGMDLSVGQDRNRLLTTNPQLSVLDD